MRILLPFVLCASAATAQKPPFPLVSLKLGLELHCVEWNVWPETGVAVAPVVSVSDGKLPASWIWSASAPADIDDAGLARLVDRLAPYRVPALSLAGCKKLSDRGLHVVAELDHLVQLDLSGCAHLTGKALTALKDLEHLRWIRYDGTKITRDAIAELDGVANNKVNDVVTKAMREQDLVGMSVAVIEAGRVTHVAGYGFENRELRIPADGDTMYRWASISKPVTAVAALQLAAAGKLRLADTVRKYVPEFPAKQQPITVRQLLCHQGGIVHYRNGRVIRTQRNYDVEHPFADMILALDTFKDSPLVAKPGSKFSYSTHGYILLGAVVKRAGGAPFAKQVEQRIKKPLGLTSMQPDYQWIDIPRRAIGYRRGPGRVIMRTTNTDVSWKLPGGGYISNVKDLIGFAGGLLSGRLLPVGMLAKMWTPQTTSDGKPTRYGLGFSVSGHGSHLRVWHSGSQEKTRTRLVMLPGRQTAVALMCNTEHAKLGPVADRILKAIGAR